MEYGEFVVDVKIAVDEIVGEFATVKFKVPDPPVERFTREVPYKSLKS